MIHGTLQGLLKFLKTENILIILLKGERLKIGIRYTKCRKNRRKPLLRRDGKLYWQNLLTYYEN